MKVHFDQYLNVRELLRQKRPSLVVELGAGGGENTRLMASLQSEWPFRIVAINDTVPMVEQPGVEWITGISYLELPKFQDGSIDFCVIDSDHNYWTLKQELDALRPKMPKGGIVCLHDTETYGHSSGKAGSYGNGAPYPLEKILKGEQQGKSLLAAVSESQDAYRLIRQSSESHGAMALERL